MIWLLLLTYAHAFSPQTVWNNNGGIAQFANKNFYMAYQGFLRALTAEPFAPVIHLNLGRAYQQNEDYDHALQEYDVIQRLPGVDRDTQFKAYFNSGTVAGAQGHIPEALQYYQKALGVDPNSVETKTNIELLWQGGGGKGKGGKPDKDDKKNEKNEKSDKNQGTKQDQSDGPEEIKKPQKFQSQNLSPEDVRKILDEIKNQEQQIRADINKKEVKETPREKNW